MSTKTTPRWLETLLREAGYRRCLIVTGNLHDVCLCVDTVEYLPVAEVLGKSLLRRGFSEIVYWDSFGGVRGIPPERWDELRKASTFGAKPREEGGQGEAYDLGPAEKKPTSQEQSVRESADDFFPVVLRTIVSNPSPRRIAFIIDWSQYLFGDSRSLSEKERNWLLILSKIFRASLTESPQEIGRPYHLLVFLDHSSSRVPSIYFQGNMNVSQVSIPLPGRLEREAFLKNNSTHFRLKSPLIPNDPQIPDLADALDGFRLRDMLQVCILSLQTSEALTFA
ncbi:MAG: hypothetical protein HY735_27820, partial [Verrucomicrobia bacterium]|nr:hypothetical protein [Verrucomicrobiota bacterium]